MLPNPPTNPLRYEPGVEHAEEDEAATIAELISTFMTITETTYTDGGHALRSAHAKSHGLLEGEFIVADGLPPALAQGLFAKPGTHRVAMRFSTSPGDLLPDNVSTPRGLALKVMDVDGPRLPGSQSDTTQDLVLVNGKAFATPSAKAFLATLKMLAKTTDKFTSGKQVLSAALRGIETVVEAAGGESPTVVTLGGQPETHILGESFFSQAPIRYGDYIAKVGVVPVSPDLTKLTKAPLNVNGVPDGLRSAVRDFFSQHSGSWEVRVQLCTNLDDMPIEDSSKPWLEENSPYITVARIEVPQQDSWAGANYDAIDTAMAFSPWHGLAAHQPLGSIMRARKPAYEQSAKFRLSRNGCPLREAS